MSSNLKMLKEITSKALLNLSITYRSGDITVFREKVSLTLNHHDNHMFSKFNKLKFLRLQSNDASTCPNIEAIFEDGLGNEIIWTACYTSESGTPKGPFRLKGGLIVSKLGIEESSSVSC